MGGQRWKMMGGMGGMPKEIKSSPRTPFALHYETVTSKSLKPVFSDGQDSTPLTHRFFIYKVGLCSQAECRGFDPRLPLHVFNYLQSSSSAACSNLLPFILFRGCGSFEVLKPGFKQGKRLSPTLQSALRINVEANVQCVPQLIGD